MQASAAVAWSGGDRHAHSETNSAPTATASASAVLSTLGLQGRSVAQAPAVDTDSGDEYGSDQFEE